MRRSPEVALALLLAVAVAVPAVAKIYPATQDKIESDLKSKKYVAKVDLYDVVVYPNALVESEYDQEAIKKGQKIIFKKIKFGNKKISMILQHPYLSEEIEMEFLFDGPISGDFSQEEEQWKKMIDAVFEEEGAGEEEGD